MNHQKLNCYQKLLRVVQALQSQMSTWPRGYAFLVDQTKRASSSAVLNLVEGNGRTSPKSPKTIFCPQLGEPLRRQCLPGLDGYLSADLQRKS